MNRKVALMLLGLTIALPLAAATVNESGEAAPCPPDQMCPADAPADSANDTHPSGRPGVCGSEVNCAGGTKPATSDNCMDGVQGNETCDGDLSYMTGPSDAGKPSTSQSSGQAATKSVPAAGVLVVLAAAGVALLAIRARR